MKYIKSILHGEFCSLHHRKLLSKQYNQEELNSDEEEIRVTEEFNESSILVSVLDHG